MNRNGGGNLRMVARVGLAAVLALMAWAAWPAGAWGWGQTGHRVVAEIAESRLSVRAAVEVDRILDGRSLAQVANWPDEIRSDSEWRCAGPFHYVTVRDGARYPESGIPEDGDAVGALLYYSEVLADPAADPESRSRALRFVVHLVGDLSQPLHVGKGCDAGGNQIRLVWFGEETNLHSVWDDRMLESRDLSFTEIVDFIDDGAAEPEAAHLDPLTWIEGAQSLFPGIYQCLASDGCPCYCPPCPGGVSSFGGCGEKAVCELKVGGPVRLSYGYRRRHEPDMDRQLLEGGLRLAALLNSVLDPGGPEPESLRELRRRFEATGDWKAPYRSCPMAE